MEDMNCGRENDLVGFLYDELDQAEKIAFQNHLSSCATCENQLASFTELRSSVMDWRNEALGAFTPARAIPPLARAASRPSALAAIRAFFDLSPLWVKGTVAFASLVFCLLAVLAVARFNQSAPANNVVASNPSAAAENLNAQVEQRVKEELQRRLSAQNQQAAATPTSSLPPDLPGRPINKMKRSTTRTETAKIARPLSKVERRELAADLRLIEDDADTGLVLLSDRINQ